MKAEFMTVTPQMAQKWLDSNGRNRRINQKVVSRYARDMMDGNWEDNGETIVIDENGLLKNGQHRLSAIIASGRNIDMLVVTDVAATVDTYDKQYRRSTMNTFEMKGCGTHLKNPRIIGIARYAMDLERGDAD